MPVPKKTLDLVEKWRQRLAPEWRITVVEQADRDDSEGACHIDDSQYQHAIIYISPDAEDLEVTVIHEILHVLMDPLISQIRRLAMDAGAGSMSGELRQQRDSEERIVERLAWALAGDEVPYGTVTL